MRFELLKILIVEDNRHMRVMLAEILRAVGVREVFEAMDGAEGLELLRSHAIDIVFTDLIMEPMDGIDFVRLVRNAPDSANPMVPVIMITGQLTRSRIGEARDAGVSEFVAKPITARAVIERLHFAIDHPRAFIRTGDYFGPDRRRRNDPTYAGPWRRAGDGPQALRRG
ncbi:MAG: response regulator [Phenylobacterium sp.]|uniref:response regulator n=1 Tax=Phenylobacterium sp. TaxID=1871053 RepID=UPI00391D9ACC